MAKKKTETIEEILVPATLEDVMSERFGRYSKYIIQERALPDARDGLKPVQRRILYAMYHDGNTFDHPYRKSAKTVGLVIGNYHPHGDTSVYDAMVRMSQDWKVRLPLIDMHGNNGSIDDDPAAAMRYTEARLSKVASTMEEDLDKETVEFAPNFDDTENEPTVLPAPFPVLLVNGAAGIAAGYATNIPPNNLGETVDAAIYRIQNPSCSLEEIMEIMPGPDFPTGGIVQGRKGLEDAFRTGKGKIVVRSKTEIVETKTCNQIVITEIPYEVVKSDIVKKMDDIRLSKDIEGIMDVRDESDRNGLRIVADIKKEVPAQTVLNYFFKNTDLQINYNYNMVAIVNKRPELLGVLEMLDAFIAHREEVVLRRSRYNLNKMEERCQVLEGLMKAISVLDEVIAIIRKSKDKKDSKERLKDAFGFSEIQAEAIVTLRLYRLSNTDIKALREEFALLVNKIEETKTIIQYPNVLRAKIVSELKEIKAEYADERRTKIEDEVQEIVIDKLSMIPNERVVVTVSRDGYAKRVSLRSFNASEGSLTGMKEGDQLIGHREAATLDTLLLFTSKGNYAYLPVYQIEEAKWKDVGTHINKFIKIDPDDKIVNCINIKNFDTYAWIVTISDGGYIKKTPISQWQVQRNSRVMPAMKIKASDTMVKAFVAYAHQEVVLVTREGMVSRYNVDTIPSTNTRSQGVKAVKLSAGDKLASACVLDEGNVCLLFRCENMAMKRIKPEEIAVTNRPVKGELVAKKVKSNPNFLTSVQSVGVYDILTFMDPAVQTIMAKDINIMARTSTFSNPLVIRPEGYQVKGIEECAIVDIPEDDVLMKDQSEVTGERVHDDFEVVSLFDDEN